jgi:hypothetical protein
MLLPLFDEWICFLSVEVQNRMTTAALNQAINRCRNNISFFSESNLISKAIMSNRLPHLFNPFPIFSHIAQSCLSLNSQDLSYHTVACFANA